MATMSRKSSRPRLKAAAIRHYLHGIFKGPTHFMAFAHAQSKHRGVEYSDFDEGFVTHEGQFMTREEASYGLDSELTSEDI